MARPSTALIVFVTVLTASVLRSAQRATLSYATYGGRNGERALVHDAVAVVGRNRSDVNSSSNSGAASASASASAWVLPPANASLRTVALIEPFLRGGFRNQAMRFTAFVMHAVDRGIPQILLPSIRFGDKYGTDRPIPFEDLFDVEEWNRHAIGNAEVVLDGAGRGGGESEAPTQPRLPRMVPYDAQQHRHWNEAYLTDRTALKTPTPRSGGRTQFLVPIENATHPLAHGGGTVMGRLWSEYGRYASSRRQKGAGSMRSPVEVLVFRALRPSAKLRAVMSDPLLMPDCVLRGDYMCFHPRVEMDMQVHSVCTGPGRTGYVRELAEIFAAAERSMPTPPASGAFIAINDATMGNNGTKFHHEWKDLAMRNLRALDTAIAGAGQRGGGEAGGEREKGGEGGAGGLWNGRVRAFTLGSALLDDDPSFEGMRSTAGSVINFFLAVQAKTFVGQSASTWSVDAAAVRYHRLGADNSSNYLFVKGGLKRLQEDPEPHNC